MQFTVLDAARVAATTARMSRAMIEK